MTRLVVPHENRPTPVVDALLTAGKIDWVKTLERDRALSIAQKFAKVNVIFRDPRGPDNLSDWMRDYPDPARCVDVLMSASSIDALPNLYIESNINEPKLVTIADARWLAAVEADRSKRLRRLGLHACIGSFGTSHPDVDMFVEFCRAYCAAGGDIAGAFAVHEYIHARWSPDDRSNGLHFIDLRASIASLPCSRMPWAITEAGFDDIGPGTGPYLSPDANTNEQQLIDRMNVYDDHCRRAGGVLCVCEFAYRGGKKWEHYEMENATEFNAQIEPSSASIEQPSAIGQGSTPPADYTHVVDSEVYGLNVRSSAANLGAANKIGALVHGQPVRVVAFVGDWARIDWPVLGFVFAANIDERPKPAPNERRLADALTIGDGVRFIDVSAYQDPIDVPYATLRDAGYIAAMIRVAIGLVEDANWLRHWRAASPHMRRWLYDAWSFTVSWSRQVDVIMGAIDKLPTTPTLALDTEMPNTTKASDTINAAIDKFNVYGVPLAWYTRASWVASNLNEYTRLRDLPLIVAHYKPPVGAGAPAVPDGCTAGAWQYVAGEKVTTEGMYWGLAMTRSLKHLDESRGMPAGLKVHAA